ncbi:uncharacterized protein LOC105698714 [Orussus abietinus]|uniref:uncharacterized protein LOC105698714 n=1 Tax=Orussus abietinus TaxID=222816 RepID=UPI000625779A|nr:uncharacterized protein LOC105698714 [Orussus abietinus]
MWFEVLPCMGIIMTALYLPQLSAYYFNMATIGHPHHRAADTFWERCMYLKDSRLGGAPFNAVGLENIPDEPK